MPGLFDQRDLQDAPRLWRQQLAADQVEVRQREQAEGARQVLRHAPVAYLGEAPQPLDHMERMLAAGAVRDRARLMARQRAVSGRWGAAARRFTRYRTP